MSNIGEMVSILKKYYNNISTGFSFYIKGEMPSKKIDNAIKAFAQGIDRKTIIGFYDTTLSGNGKQGYIFTDSKIYYKETLEKPKKIWYDDIKKVVVTRIEKDKDCDRYLNFIMNDDTQVIWTSCFLNKTPLCQFINEVIKIKNDNQYNFEMKKNDDSGAMAAGISIGNYGSVNKLFDEEKFGAARGHGFAAERANNLYDQLTGNNAKVVGDSNIKNGADRIVNGVQIQSKYCNTGSKCIAECFENGKMRYTIDNGTKPMQIEVPSDKYQDAVKAMENRIKNGQVPGVTDPNEAKNIVRKGHFSYNQVKNIAKAGTIESISYDSVNGIIISSSAFGVSAAVTFATSIWSGEEFDTAIKLAMYSGLKVGGTAFITSVLASQLSKAGLNSALVASSEVIVGMMGPKASAILINAFRGGSKIYGAAAMKSAAKLLRGNVITGGVTVIVLSSFDIVNIFRGRISGKQLFKNITNTTTTVAAGAAGWLGGAAIGSAILPGIGTVIGGLLGSVGSGAIAGKATNTVLDKFVEDDAEEMIKIIEKKFSDLAVEYLLNKKEAEISIDNLKEKLSGNTLKDMYADSNKEQFATKLLVPIIEKEVSKRRKVNMPLEEQIQSSLRMVLEEISDNIESSTVQI